MNHSFHKGSSLLHFLINHLPLIRIPTAAKSITVDIRQDVSGTGKLLIVIPDISTLLIISPAVPDDLP